MSKPKLIWIASMVFGVGGWMVTLAGWEAALTPVSLGGLLMILGSVTASALGGSIIKPK